MKAIILAAGRGSRMGKLTEDQPKCLTRLAGRSLLDWQIDALRAAGIEEIGIVRGYRKELLPDSLRHFDNERWQKTNMVVSLSCASEWLSNSPCIVSYSDIVFAPETIQLLMVSPAAIAISYNTEWRRLWEARFDDPLADAETLAVEADGRVSDIGRRPKSMEEVRGQYMGLLKFEPSGWAQVAHFLASLVPSEVDRLDMTGLLQRLIASGVVIQGLPVNGMWYEIDTESDWQLCEKEIADSNGAHWLVRSIGGA
ncbi:MAG: phosphocholine cytidylyltransferase family protein [Hydrogenophilales bacterium]|nr:phosphocholine cytidylyltransferase family protein [Hydrogenophilales bacterium]